MFLGAQNIFRTPEEIFLDAQNIFRTRKQMFLDAQTFSVRANKCFWTPKHFPDAQTNVSGRPNIFRTRKQMFLDAQTLKTITKRDESHFKVTKRQKRRPVQQ
jgi:hypothetical protein